MRRYRSLLDQPPRPVYERNFGHQLEDIVEAFINDKLPGLSSTHASEQADRVNAQDILVTIDGTEIEKPFQVTMTTNPEVLAAKKSRGVPLIVIPKEEIDKAWKEFEAAKEEKPDLAFSYDFLSPEAKKKIIQDLLQEPAIKRHLLQRT